jgi:hypothetical protein
LPRADGIVEQDDAAEPEASGECFQPVRNGLAVEAEDEEFADLHLPDWTGGHFLRRCGAISSHSLSALPCTRSAA